MTLRRAHLWMGLLSLAVFVATGMSMFWRLPDLAADDQLVRFLYRANHVYILLAGLVNLALGVWEPKRTTRPRMTLRRIGSTLALVAPAVLAVAFVVEPRQASPVRLISAGGVLAVLLGTLLQIPARDRGPSEPEPAE